MRVEFFVGTYTSNPGASGKGIYHVRASADAVDGAKVTLAAAAVNPSWLALTPDGGTLLAVEERMRGDGAALRLFSVDGARLTPLARADLPGSDPCHIAVHPTLPLAVTAHYSDGSLALWSLRAEAGRLPAPQRIALSGSGPDKVRQEASHAHFAGFLDGGSRFAVTDLGADSVTFFRLVPDGQGWRAEADEVVHLPPGSGPRHLAIAPDNQMIHVACELHESVCTLSRASEGWRVTGTLPVFDWGPGDAGALSAIRRTSDGILLVGGRRQGQVARLQVVGGDLHLLDRTAVGGDWPRDMALSPDERFLAVANQHSDRVTLLRRNDSGSLTLLPGSIPVGSPVAIVFAKD
jgi:6-phosphogluconolactonase